METNSTNSIVLEDTNLFRNHYYILAGEFNNGVSCKLKLGTNSYLHKCHRGYGYCHFTKEDMKAFIKVEMYKYLHINFRNVNNLLKSAFTPTPEAIINYEFVENDTSNYIYMLPDNVFKTGYLKIEKPPKKTNFESAHEEWLYGEPDIEYGNFNVSKLTIIEFINYINDKFGDGTTKVLASPILATFKDVDVFITEYEFTKSETLLILRLLPSLYEYNTYKHVICFMKNVDKMHTAYKTPILSKSIKQ